MSTVAMKLYELIAHCDGVLLEFQRGNFRLGPEQLAELRRLTPKPNAAPQASGIGDAPTSHRSPKGLEVSPAVAAPVVASTVAATGETPRTEANLRGVDIPTPFAEFTRQLERELAHMAGLLAGQIHYNETAPSSSIAATSPLTEWLRDNAPDCGDNSCLFGGRGKGGMRTNGGCRCFKDLPTAKRIYVKRLFSALTPSSAAPCGRDEIIEECAMICAREAEQHDALGPEAAALAYATGAIRALKIAAATDNAAKHLAKGTRQ